MYHRQITHSVLENNVVKESHLERLMRKNDERERSRAKTNLARSKSSGSLQTSVGSIQSMKALFESKAATQNKVKSSFRAMSTPSSYKAADIMQVMNGEVEEVKRTGEKPKTHIPADAPVTDAKKDQLSQKVN